MDGTVTVRERYKIVRVLGAGDGYACAQAVDLRDREGRDCLLNVYGGELIKKPVGSFDRLRQCPELVDMFTADDCLVTVFRDTEGRDIDSVFYRGDDHPWRDRIDYADKLFHLALSMTDLPPEVSCAAMLSDNVLIDEASRRVSLRFRIRPMEGMSSRELALLTCDQVKKILRRRPDSSYEELMFLDDLDRTVFPGPVQLYAFWLERRAGIIATREELEERNDIARRIAIARGWVKWGLGKGRQR